MKIIKNFILFLALSGCSSYASKEFIDAANKKCENNDGIKYIELYFDYANLGKVYCNNDAVFRIDLTNNK